jgi:hypothetical protein
MSRSRSAPPADPPPAPAPSSTAEELAAIGARGLGARLERWGPLVVLAATTVLAIVMYANCFSGELVGDDLSFHYAEATRMADCLRAGDFDLWNPSANAGYASAYYYQALPQLTPAVLSAVTGVDVLFWFQLCIFLPLVLAPAAAYRALRVIGTPAWHAAGAGFAILVTASNSRWGFGADGTFSVGLYTQTWALAAFPLALGHGVRWLRDGEGLGAATGWAVFITICHPFAGVALGIALGAGAVTVLAARGVVGLAGGVPELAVVGYALDVTRWGTPLILRRGLPTAVPPPRAGATLAAMALRIIVLGGLIVIGSASIYLTVFVDYAGFGGFPHRVPDEVGPGFGALWTWLYAGNTLDCAGWNGRWRMLTALLPVVFVLGRDRALPWLWGGAIAYAVLLGLGPNLPRTGDDLFPMVRFYGPFQICLALAIGAGAVALGRAVWRRTFDLPDIPGLIAQAALASGATAMVVALSISAVGIAHFRARTIGDLTGFPRAEMREVARAIAAMPPGRKQARAGTENHFNNLLPYVDARVPALIQMGGGGLQASPNYDFLWSVSDAKRQAWVYAAPYVTYVNDKAADAPEGETVFTTERYGVRKLPAAALVSPVEVAAAPLPAERFAARKAAIEWLKSDAALADKLIAYAGSPGLASAPRGQVLAIARQDSPGDEPDLTATVRAEAPTTFVVRESWHPRWRGFVDGKEVALRRVTPDFFAVDVPAGEHRLAFRFDRPWWAWASWLLVLAAILAGRALGPRLARIGMRATPRA